MQKLLNLDNYKDDNFVLLLIATVVCFSSFQTVLNPSLDYIALNMKGNQHTFYNYATIASVALAIPQASSLIAGYLVNNVVYKKLINIIFCIIWLLSGCMLFYTNDFLLYAIFVILNGILLNAMFCSLDRQIVILLADKIKAYQNDIFILGSIFAIVNYKLSSYIFLHFQAIGIIVYYLFLTIMLYISLQKIPAVNRIVYDKDSYNHIVYFPSIIILLRIFCKHGKFLMFWATMLIIMAANASLTLLFTTKIYHEHLPTNLWSSNMSLIALGGLLGALVMKITYLNRISSLIMIGLTMILYGICLCGISFSISPYTLSSILLFCGFLSPCALINMNSIFFKYITRDSELIAISPIVNGAITSTFYIVCSIFPILINIFLTIGTSYKLLLQICGFLEILPAFNLLICYRYFKVLD